MYRIASVFGIIHVRFLYQKESPKVTFTGFFIYFTSSRFLSHNATRLMESTLVVDFFVLRRRLLRSASTAIDSEIASVGATLFMVAQKSWLTTMITRRQHVSSAIVVTLPRMADVTTCFAIHESHHWLCLIFLWLFLASLDHFCFPLRIHRTGSGLARPSILEPTPWFTQIQAESMVG